MKIWGGKGITQCAVFALGGISIRNPRSEIGNPLLWLISSGFSNILSENKMKGETIWPLRRASTRG
jgi:hypothetical protein